MIVQRGYSFRLYGTPEQESVFGQYAGACRFVYNLAFEQRRDWWRQYKANTGSAISYASQCRELSDLRREVDWICAASVTCLQQALRDVDRAFSRFFAGEAEYPRPRRRGERDAFRFQGRECPWRRINDRWGTVKFPKIGDVKFRITRDIPGRVNNVTVARDDMGWRVVFSVEFEVKAEPITMPSVGIDRGVAKAIALSDGRLFGMDKGRLLALEKKAKKHARAMARKARGSKRWAEAKRRLSRTQAQAARLRKHWNHERSCEIAEKFSVVAMEDLNVLGMTARVRGTASDPGRMVAQKSGLNRAILRNGWRQFETFLTYKVAVRGGHVVKVNPAYTSQTCSACGTVDKKSRESQAVFRCSHCGHEANADVNAAMNILRAGTQLAQRLGIGPPLKREHDRAA